MKRKLFLVLCALLTMIGVQQVKAQVEPENDGIYYIYNEEADLFLSRGETWGTQGVAKPVGLPWKVSVSAGAYTLHMYDLTIAGSPATGLGDNGYADNGSPIAFTPEGNATDGYTLKNGDNYITCPATAGAISLSTTSSVWKFLTQAQYDAVLAARVAAQESAVATAKGIVIPDGKTLNDVVSDADNWASVTTNDGVPTSAKWTATKHNDRGGNVNWDTSYGTEMYQCGNGHYTRTISGLKPGIYKVSARGMKRMGNNATCTTMGNAGYPVSDTYLTANGNVIRFKAWYEDRASDSNPNSTGDFVNIVNNGGYTTEGFTYVAEDGNLVLDASSEAYWGGSWFLFNGVSYTYYNNEVSDDDATEIINRANTALSSTMADSYRTALESAKSTFDANRTIANYNALNSAIDNTAVSIASYAIIAAGSVPDNSLDGWTCENDNTFHINTWSVEGNSDGSEMKTPFIENWVGKGSYLGAGKVYYQLQGLNPGEVYYAQALVRSYNEASSDAPNGPNFFINDDVVDMTEEGTTFTYNNMSGIYATLRGAATVGSDGTLTLGVEIADDRNYNWVAFKSISIRSMKDALNAAIEEVEATIPAGNVGTDVFQYDASAVAARQSKIDAAKVVYNDDDATQSQMESQIDILNNEKTAFALNDPDPEKRYCIVVATSGHAMEGKAVGIALGTTSDNNPTGYSINTSNTTNQSVAFTKVSTNTYNISFVTAAGTTYLTYGSLNGSAAGWNKQQIQATTNATNKGEFKIVATATANVFNIYNTVYNANIDCQDNGSLYTDDNITKDNFTFVEATAANLAVSDGKLGTFIAPFDIVLPTNVKAYSATSDESKVTLTKIAEGSETLAAGTPAIVYGDGSDVDVTFYGVPTVEDNQPVGALVGILDDGNKTVPAESYVLQTQGGNQAFYKLNTSATGKLNRCYVISGSGNARLVISFDETTAISAIEAVDAEAAALKDGKFLENGKIVIVKNGVKYSANGQILK